MPDSSAEKFHALLQQLGILRVICVDDIYEDRLDIEGIVAWGAIPGNRKALDGILKQHNITISNDADTVRAELSTLLTDKDNHSVAVALRLSIDKFILKAANATDDDRSTSTDRIALQRLDVLMEGFPQFSRLTPDEWISQRDQVLAKLVDDKTLFLFDENLGDMKPKGSEYFTEILKADSNSNAYLVLLSYTIELGQEHEVTREYKKKSVVATAISKRDLSGGDDTAEQLRVKLRAAVLWRESESLRQTCKVHLETAASKAYERVRDLAHLEFDEVVFRSSYIEGVHEMDTLIRVYTNAFAASLRDSLRSSAIALEDIDKLRSFRGEESRFASPGSTACKLQWDEYYERGLYVNGCMMPPEPGDVYRITTEDDTSAEYVLIAPPCDLVIRSTTGTRESRATQGVLCEISGEPDKNQAKKTFRLDCYDRNTGKPAWVYFPNNLIIDLWLLDLVAVNDTGQAVRIINDDVPKHLSDGWQRYLGDVLIPRCHQLVARWNAWHQLGTKTRDGIGVRPAYEITLNNRLRLAMRVEKRQNESTLSLGIERMRRLTPILQGELIRSYSDYLARPARPHSLNLEPNAGS
jgi:hypothetical protein